MKTIQSIPAVSASEFIAIAMALRAPERAYELVGHLVQDWREVGAMAEDDALSCDPNWPASQRRHFAYMEIAQFARKIGGAQ